MFVEEPSRPQGPAEISRHDGTIEGQFGFIAD
jgi:hypothetical protein